MHNLLKFSLTGLNLAKDSFTNPHHHLRNIRLYLGVDAPAPYLQDCAAIVFKSPRKTRHQIDWPCELIDFTHNQISQYSFLHGYTYTS